MGTTPSVWEAPPHQVLTWSPREAFVVSSLPRAPALGPEIRVEVVWDVCQGLRSLNTCPLRGMGPSQ